MLIYYCVIDCYIGTGKPFGVFNLTAHRYKISTSAKAKTNMMRYLAFHFWLAACNILTRRTSTETEAFIPTNKNKLINLTATYPCHLDEQLLWRKEGIPENHYFCAQALKKLSKMSLEKRALGHEYNHEKGCESEPWKVSMTKLALDPIICGKAREGDKEIVLRQPFAQGSFLWHTLSNEADTEDADILACSLLSLAELKKLKDGCMSFKTSVAWWIVKQKKTNG